LGSSVGSVGNDSAVDPSRDNITRNSCRLIRENDSVVKIFQLDIYLTYPHNFRIFFVNIDTN